MTELLKSEQSASGPMEAKVTAFGGEVGPGGVRTVQHWQLVVDGMFIADTSSPKIADLFRRIAERCSS